MAVLLDTAGVDVADRADAYDGVLNSAVFPSHVDLDDAVPEPTARVERWTLGAGADVVKAVTSGHRLVRTRWQVARAPAEKLSFAITLGGTVQVQQANRSYQSLGTVTPVDARSPYRCVFGTSDAGTSVSMCAQIDLSLLDLSAETVQESLPRLPSSPLYELFRSHLSRLSDVAASVEDTPAAAMLGSATSELARALVASASADERLGRESLADVLGMRIDSYIQRHLGDQDLNAAQIARAHGISVRYLYRLFARRGVSLEQQIIHERLEQARRQLIRQADAGRTIETIARRAGFAHPQHFSRRFRESYGMTPRDWRALHLRDA